MILQASVDVCSLSIFQSVQMWKRWMHLQLVQMWRSSALPRRLRWNLRFVLTS